MEADEYVYEYSCNLLVGEVITEVCNLLCPLHIRYHNDRSESTNWKID